MGKMTWWEWVRQEPEMVQQRGSVRRPPQLSSGSVRAKSLHPSQCGISCDLRLPSVFQASPMDWTIALEFQTPSRLTEMKMG